jgi:hypothetical protein
MEAPEAPSVRMDKAIHTPAKFLVWKLVALTSSFLSLESIATELNDNVMIDKTIPIIESILYRTTHPSYRTTHGYTGV